MIDDFSLKQDDIAEKVSKSRSAIANSLRLLNLDEKIQQMITDEMISSGHARALLAITNKDMQIKIANKIFDEKLSVRETEKLVKSLLKISKNNNKNEVKINPIYKSIEEKMKELLGTKVKITNKNKKGKIEIEYYSEEEFERIIDIIQR